MSNAIALPNQRKLTTRVPLEMLFIPKGLEINDIPNTAEQFIAQKFPNLFVFNDTFTVIDPRKMKVVAILCQRYINKTRYHIQQAKTAKAWQGQGIMGWLLNQSLMHSKGFETLQLDVHWMNYMAREYWMKKGFKRMWQPSELERHDSYEYAIPKDIQQKSIAEFDNMEHPVREFSDVTRQF